jgi:predicted alpha/beta hydrolase family esterase
MLVIVGTSIVSTTLLRNTKIWQNEVNVITQQPLTPTSRRLPVVISCDDIHVQMDSANAASVVHIVNKTFADRRGRLDECWALTRRHPGGDEMIGPQIR